jgi:hypothetical protein
MFKEARMVRGAYPIILSVHGSILKKKVTISIFHKMYSHQYLYILQSF